MVDDIVDWLRGILNVDRFVEYRCREAADLIEQLREERDAARRECLMWVAQRCSPNELKEEYRDRGWEYLLHEKEEADHNNNSFRKSHNG